MKNVYFILANQGYGNSLYLPYTSACLAAYAWSLEDVRTRFCCADFFYRREKIQYVLDHLQDPAVVGFTCYTWTREYNKILSRRIKEEFPDCLIVFGGHEVYEQDDLAALYPDADFFIFGDGEVPFGQLLRAIGTGGDYAGIPNIAYKTDGRVIVNERVYNLPLDDYPSPYLTGIMDEMLERYPEINFCATIETNRGCPYECAYCDWSETHAIRKFPMEKIYAELDWCSSRKIDYIFCADGNFGILDRDYDIARRVVELKQKNGFPCVFSTCFAKNSNDNVFRISKLFFDNGVNKAVTLSYQTVGPEALRNINRENFTMASFSEIVKRYSEHSIPTFTELILGLPGETLQSFKQGICSIVEAGQHDSITVSGCHVFRKALINQPDYRKKFGIRSIKIPMNNLHMALPDLDAVDDITEYTDFVVGTKDMTFPEMVKAFLFAICLQGFHLLGIMKCFSLYIHNELHVSYYDLYNDLLDYIDHADGTDLQRLFADFRARCSDLSNGEWTYRNPKFGKIGWYYEEGLFMEIAAMLDVFWQELPPFLRRYDIPEDIFEQLAAYQKFMIRLPGQTVVTGEFDYDFYTYFEDAVRLTPTPLQKRKIRVQATVKEYVDTWEDYALRVMLYAKKKGALLLTTEYNSVKVTYPEETVE